MLRFNGSMGGLNVSTLSNVVGMARNSANGYWLVGSDGGIYSFGATFYGLDGRKDSERAPSPQHARRHKTGDGYFGSTGQDGAILHAFGVIGCDGGMNGHATRRAYGRRCRNPPRTATRYWQV